MRPNFIAQFIQFLKHWLSDVWLGIVVEKIGSFLLTNIGLETLQFSVHLINLLSILLRCNGFTEIQKAEVDKMGSRPSDSYHELF